MDRIKLEYTTIATKISPVDRQRLENIAEAFGLSFYELLQGLCLGLLRYFDKGILVTSEKNTFVNAVANILFSLPGSFCPLQIKGKNKEKIQKCIAFVERPSKERPQVVVIEKDTEGIKESYNYDEMLTMFLNSCDPDVLEALNREKNRNGYFSLFHVLHDLVLSRAPEQEDEIKEEINEMFQDIRIEYGLKTNDDVFYKRRHRTGSAEDRAYMDSTREKTMRL